jgi:small subunit ribosomal protein S20
MAHSPSAQKRVRQNLKCRARNRWRTTKVKQALKQFRTVLQEGDSAKAEAQVKGLYKLVDQIADTGTIHKNAAARYKSRLTRHLNALKKTKAAGAQPAKA